MAKKKAKKRTGMKAKVKCPLCKCTSSMAMPKTVCKSSGKCPCCKETISSKDCCLFCDYSNKPCRMCKKK